MNVEVNSHTFSVSSQNVSIILTILFFLVGLVMYEARQDREISLVQQQVHSNNLFNNNSNKNINDRLRRIESQLDKLLAVK